MTHTWKSNPFFLKAHDFSLMHNDAKPYRHRAAQRSFLNYASSPMTAPSLAHVGGRDWKFAEANIEPFGAVDPTYPIGATRNKANDRTLEALRSDPAADSLQAPTEENIG